MAKSTVNKIIPIWIQNVLISLVLAIMLFIGYIFCYEYFNQPEMIESCSNVSGSIDINLYGMIGKLLGQLVGFWIVNFFLLSFLRLIYSTFAEAKNADLD